MIPWANVDNHARPGEEAARLVQPPELAEKEALMTTVGFLYPGHAAEDDYPRMERILGNGLRLAVEHGQHGPPVTPHGRFVPPEIVLLPHIDTVWRDRMIVNNPRIRPGGE